MPVVTDPGEPEDEDEDEELTPEEREALRRLMEHLRSVMPKIDISKTVAPPGVLDAITKLNGLGIKQSIFLDSAAIKFAMGDAYKNIGVLNSDALKGVLGAQSGVAAQIAKMGGPGTTNSAIGALAKAGLPQMAGVSEAIRAMNSETFAPFKNLAKLDQSVASSLLPALVGQRVMQRQLAGINADLLKVTKLPQTQLGLLTNQLARNVDFGLGKGMEGLLKQFAAKQSSWMAGIAPLLSGLKFRIYPDNLDDIEDLKISDVQAVVMLDGIALYGVPRTSIAEAIIRAEDSATRRRIMGRQWKRIVADCREVLDGCESPSLASEARHAMAAIEALEAGHTQAAQALVGSVIDTLVAGYFGENRKKFTPNFKTKTSEVYKRMHVRQYIALAPVWQAYQQFFVEKGDPVPPTFSRHATAHTVSGRQYSRVNTVQALMIACGILLFLEEEEAKERAA